MILFSIVAYQLFSNIQRNSELPAGRFLEYNILGLKQLEFHSFRSVFYECCTNKNICEFLFNAQNCGNPGFCGVFPNKKWIEEWLLQPRDWERATGFVWCSEFCVNTRELYMGKWSLYVLPQCSYPLQYSQSILYWLIQWLKAKPTFLICFLKLLLSMSLFFLEQNSLYMS